MLGALDSARLVALMDGLCEDGVETHSQKVSVFLVCNFTLLCIHFGLAYALTLWDFHFVFSFLCFIILRCVNWSTSTLTLAAGTSPS